MLSGSARRRTEAISAGIRLRVTMPSSASRTASITQQWVLTCSTTTLPAATTRLTAFHRSVRYEAVNAMLLNEFLKEHRKVEQHEATITQLKSTVAQQQRDFQGTAAHQQKQIEALTAGLQKMSAQVETS